MTRGDRWVYAWSNKIGGWRTEEHSSLAGRAAVAAHGSVPAEFSLNTVIPIPNGRNITISPITLSSVFGMVLDLIILNRHADILITSDLQFDFKAKRSTNI